MGNTVARHINNEPSGCQSNWIKCQARLGEVGGNHSDPDANLRPKFCKSWTILLVNIQYTVTYVAITDSDCYSHLVTFQTFFTDGGFTSRHFKKHSLPLSLLLALSDYYKLLPPLLRYCNNVNTTRTEETLMT